MSWVRVCAVAELPAGDAKVVPATPPVALFNADGDYYAIDDTCTHEDASLADGWIEDCTIACPLHQAMFCLKTGEALTSPAVIAVRTYPVRVEGDEIFVDLPDGY